MEHLIFHLLVEAIHAIDRRLQHPLTGIVPEYGLLRAHPQTYLARSEVVIGPRRRHALAAVFGFLAGAAVVAALVFILADQPRPKQRDPSRPIGVLVSFVAVFLVVRSMSLKAMPGGQMTLREAGVEIVYRERQLFLPWQLFRAPGHVFQPDNKVAVLPIDPTVPVAVTEVNGEVSALLPDMLALPSAHGSDMGQLTIKDQYEVQVGELGELLLAIGRGLSPDSAQYRAAEAASPLAVPEDDGWLRIQLTRLPFPPYCAACGEMTSLTTEVIVAKQTRASKIEVPYCYNCAVLRRRRRLTWGFVGFLAGATVGVLLAGVVGAGQKNFDLVIVLGVLFGFGIGVTCGVIAQAIAKFSRLPVTWRDYQPERGSVRLRFRDPRRAAPLLDAMGLAVVSEPVPAAGASL